MSRSTPIALRRPRPIAHAKRTADEALPIVVNRPPRGVEHPQVGALWGHRELLYFLTWRDVNVRYKQTVLGALWAVLQPVLATVVFTIVFGQVAGLGSAGRPYALFVYAGLVPWTFFSTSISQAAASLVMQERILTRVYFPRLLIPVAAIAAVLVDLAITLVVLVALMLWYGVTPGLELLAAPAVVMLAVVVATAVGTWLAAVNVRYRDVRYVTPFLVQIWFFASPVAYSSDVIAERWRPLAMLNPMVGVIEAFRWSTLGTEPPGRSLAVATVIGSVGLVIALYWFRRLEATFADDV